MITKLIVSNYKSIGPKTLIKFGKLTALVGQNGSGKSNIIDIFKFLSDCMVLGLEGAITKRYGIKALRRWSGGQPLNLSIEISITEKDFKASYKFEITSHKKHDYIVKYEKAEIFYNTGESYKYEIANQKWVEGLVDLKPTLDPLNLALPLISGDIRIAPLGDVLRNIQIYSIYPDNLRTPQKYDPVKPMAQHGNNWISILKDQDEKTWKPELISALNQLTNEIDEIEIKQLSGYLLARFRHGLSGKSSKAKWFDASQESDGTLRIAGIISALLQNPALPIVGIEEPELTIHPGAISLLFDFINQAAKTSQVILTTHSPEILDHLKPEQVRIIEKSKDYTKVHEMSEEGVEIVKSKLMSLGELHRTQGLDYHQLKLEL